jgi:hypothetical protein
MAARALIRLRLLIPAVENSVAGNAYRPRDIVRTRGGKTVEIGNTDAEGRLILCDALNEADSEHPDLLIDCATLTGAARVALGPDLGALYCDDDAVADGLLKAGAAAGDPWRMPLWRPYRKLIDGKCADEQRCAGTSPVDHRGAVPRSSCRDRRAGRISHHRLKSSCATRRPEGGGNRHAPPRVHPAALCVSRACSPATRPARTRRRRTAGLLRAVLAAATG